MKRGKLMSIKETRKLDKSIIVLWGLCLLLSLTPMAIKANNGWVKVDGKWFYYDNSIKKTGWYHDDKDCWYFFEKDGSMKTGWIASGNYWYYLNPDNGILQTGWQEIDGKRYYLNSGGIMQKRALRSNDVTYIFDEKGALIETRPNLETVKPEDRKAMLDLAIVNYTYISETLNSTIKHYSKNASTLDKSFHSNDVHDLLSEYDKINSIAEFVPTLDTANFRIFEISVEELLSFCENIQKWLDTGSKNSRIPNTLPSYNEHILLEFEAFIVKLYDDLGQDSKEFKRTVKQYKLERDNYFYKFDKYIKSKY